MISAVVQTATSQDSSSLESSNSSGSSFSLLSLHRRTYLFPDLEPWAQQPFESLTGGAQKRIVVMCHLPVCTIQGSVNRRSWLGFVASHLSRRRFLGSYWSLSWESSWPFCLVGRSLLFAIPASSSHQSHLHWSNLDLQVLQQMLDWTLEALVVRERAHCLCWNQALRRIAFSCSCLSDEIFDSGHPDQDYLC